MQHSIIKNNNLDQPDIKQKIFKYLYSSIKQNSNPNFISSIDDINNIKSNDYIICPKYIGIRSWIVFMHEGNNYYAVTFPKNTNVKNNIVLYPVEITVNTELYNGTIMEGIYNVTGHIKSFIVDEVYYLAGRMQLTKSKDDRLDYINKYAYDNFGGNPKYRICICNHYQINKESLTDLYEKIKEDQSIQEIIFYPKLHGGKIYKYVITSEDVIDNVIKMTNFNMKKTKKPDIYDLIDLNTDQKIDIAIIPDMVTSKKCKHWFIDNKTDILLVTCQYLFDKNKWLPISIVE